MLNTDVTSKFPSQYSTQSLEPPHYSHVTPRLSGCASGDDPTRTSLRPRAYWPGHQGAKLAQTAPTACADLASHAQGPLLAPPIESVSWDGSWYRSARSQVEVVPPVARETLADVVFDEHCLVLQPHLGKYLKACVCNCVFQRLSQESVLQAG